MLERPAARFVFVVGKGGVGKSTTAAGLALAWAEAGRTVHLLSTDPAHSLGDVLGRALEPGRVESRCSDRLTVEELDAESRARVWLDALQAPLTALLEQGSYLDGEDVARFASLRLPGVDEVMAALRLLELAAAPADTIVVDTAPTGHTLRLFDAPAVLESWTELLDALARKAQVVASALTGRDRPGPGAELRARLHAQLQQFDRRVLRSATCVLVTRSGAPVAAESERLARALAERGLAVQATVHVGAGGAPAAVVAPWLDPAPHGCAGLRGWHGALLESDAAAAPSRTRQTAAPGPGPAAETGTPDGAAVTWLRARPQRLLLFAGKGGVGKSTCAAAAAFALADRGPVLLLSADPAGSLGDILERAVGAQPTPIARGLRAVQIDAAAALAAWRGDFRAQGDALLARVGLGGDPALDRRVLEAVWNVAPPGMDELVALAELMAAVAAAEETVVLDAAPTGHLLRLLALPATAHEWTHAAMRTLLKYGVGGELDALAARLLAFARHLKQFRSTLADAGRTGAIVVTIEQPVVRAETDRLLAALARAGVPLAATLTNQSSTRRDSTLRSAIAHLRAPIWPEPPRGAVALRGFVSRWELE